jgi:GTP-binding protein Era
MNAFVGERLSIITSKAQTTRHRILGIVNGEIFKWFCLILPGLLSLHTKCKHRWWTVKSFWRRRHINLHGWNREQDLKDEAFFNKIVHSKIPVLLLLNKIDNSNQEQLENKLLLDRESLMQRYILYPPCRTLMFQKFFKG